MPSTSSDLTQSLDLFEFAPGKKASWGTLKRMLQDVPTALFFAKAYDLDYIKVSEIIGKLFSSPLINALQEGTHSVDLQDYVVDMLTVSGHESVAKRLDFSSNEIPDPELLAYMWEQIEVVVAKSIKEVAEKLADVLDRLPSKEADMVFGTMAKVNRQRPTIGVHSPSFKHDPVPGVLVILDVSGSMTERTIKEIIDDVVALSWNANATMAIVSNDTFVWDPGTFSTRDVLAKAQYGGTQYETLYSLFDGRDWGTVITIADYDSSYGAKHAIGKMTGRVGQLLDFSLVNRPTFLAECVGQLADEVKPMLIATGSHVLSN